MHIKSDSVKTEKEVRRAAEKASTTLTPVAMRRRALKIRPVFLAGSQMEKKNMLLGTRGKVILVNKHRNGLKCVLLRSGKENL